jgi:PKD repeat protein
MKKIFFVLIYTIFCISSFAQPPVANFKLSDSIGGFTDQIQCTNLSTGSPTSFKWSLNPPSIGINTFAGYLTLSNIFYKDSIVSDTLSNPFLYLYDAGTFDVCLRVTNSFGSDSICKSSYLKVVNSYMMCNGSDSVSHYSEGFVYDQAGPLNNYQGSYIGYCPAGFRIATCADSITLTIKRFKLYRSDTLIIRKGGPTGPIIQKLTRNNLPDSLKTYRIAGNVFLQMNADPTSVDSGFVIYWKASSGGVGFTINNSSQCENNNHFLFTDTSNLIGGTNNRHWNFGDGIFDTASTSIANKIYSNAKIYPVSLIVNSNRGCTDSVTKPVILNAKPTVGYSINNSYQCLNGNNFLFTDTSSIGLGSLTRNWDFGNGINSSIKSPSISYAGSNSYQVKIVSTSNKGCKDSISKIVTVYPKPNSGFTINNSAQCINGNSFLFTDTTNNNGGTYRRQWNLGTGLSDTFSVINPTKTYSSIGNYIIKITSQNNLGCIDSTSKTIMVTPKPIVGFTVNNFAQCLSGNTFLLNDTSIISLGTIIRSWNFGDSSHSSISNPNKIYSSAGIYQIKLLINSNNCADSTSKTITVFTQPKSGFTVNTLSQCLNENSFSFNDTTYSTSTRLWNLGDLTTNTNDTFSKTYINAGIYTVKLKVMDIHNCSDSSIKVITVKANPAKPIVSAITKSLLQSTLANSYQWFLNNNVLTNATNQTLTITQNGNYTVKIDTSNGCTSISNPFAASSVGMNELAVDNEIKIYPNPATNELYINASSLQNGREICIEVFDLKASKLISVYENTNSVIKIDISKINAGMYFVLINSKAYKFIKCFSN